MLSRMNKFGIVGVAVAAMITLGLAGTASAGGRDDHRGGGWSHSDYYPARVYYVPQPVYYPAPVYYDSGAAYYSAPTYYAPPVYYYPRPTFSLGFSFGGGHGGGHR